MSFFKGSCLMLWKNMIDSIGGKLSLICGLPMTLMREMQKLESGQNRHKNKLEISGDKTKLITHNAQSIKRVKSSNYLSIVVSDDGTKPEVLCKYCTSHRSSNKADGNSRDNSIFHEPKQKLMRSLAISIFMYAREMWTLKRKLRKEQRCCRRLLNIVYKQQQTI